MMDTPYASGAAPAARRAPDEPAWEAPRQPRTVLDTGLPPRLVTELVLKALQASGKTPLPQLSGKLKLPVSVLREVLGQLVADQQAEVAWCGGSDIDVQYQLTGIGQRAALDCQAQSRYVGPAPVPLAAYREQVAAQSLRQPHAPRITAAALAAGLAEEGLAPAVRDLIGAALHSQRSLLLYGPSGSGKTRLARRLGTLQDGLVAVPYALLAGREIIQLHDPLVHPAPAPQQLRALEERRSCDARWALCRRPLVHVGAELTAAMLELRPDPANGVYHAPPHLQANNGMLVVDDVGRQRIAAAELLTRWIGPLDQGVDQLSLAGGQTETLPFDATLVFATSVDPHAVFDDAFMRRIGYKIPVGALSEASYRALLRRQCRLRAIDCDDDALDYLLARLHRGAGRPLLASYPQELLGRIADFASFAGSAPRLTRASIEQAWRSMFAACGAAVEADPARTLPED